MWNLPEDFPPQYPAGTRLTAAHSCTVHTSMPRSEGGKLRFTCGPCASGQGKWGHKGHAAGGAGPGQNLGASWSCPCSVKLSERQLITKHGARRALETSYIQVQEAVGAFGIDPSLVTSSGKLRLASAAKAACGFCYSVSTGLSATSLPRVESHSLRKD